MLWRLLTNSLLEVLIIVLTLQIRTLMLKSYMTGPFNKGARTGTPSLSPPHYPPQSCLKPSSNLSHREPVPFTQQVLDK